MEQIDLYRENPEIAQTLELKALEIMSNGRSR